MPRNKKKIRIFISRLVEKWKNFKRTLSNYEEPNKDWLDSEILLFEEPTKEFAECSPKTQINRVSQLVNGTPCEELKCCQKSTSNTNMFEYGLSILHAGIK